MKKYGIFALATIFLFLGIFLYARAGWLDPSSQPPTGNVAPPVTVGSAGQVKAGGLAVGANCVQPTCKYGFVVDKGLAIINTGNLGVGSPNPLSKIEVIGAGVNGIAFFAPSATSKGFWIDKLGQVGVGVADYSGSLKSNLIVNDQTDGTAAPKITIQGGQFGNPTLRFRQNASQPGGGFDWDIVMRGSNSSPERTLNFVAVDGPTGPDNLMTLTMGNQNGATRVGIGTNDPREKLHIAGNIEISGILKPNGNQGNTGEVLTRTGSGMNWQSSTGQNIPSQCMIVLKSGNTATKAACPAGYAAISGSVSCGVGAAFVTLDCPIDPSTGLCITAASNGPPITASGWMGLCQQFTITNVYATCCKQ